MTSMLYRISFQLSNYIWNLVLKWDFFPKDTIGKQLVRAIDSISSNIAEGFARKTNKEFIQFLYISHGSVAEVEAQLYVALDLVYIDQEKFNLLYSLSYEISKMIMGLIKYLSTATPGLRNSLTQKHKGER